jgi:hypothetical protein
VVVAREEDEIHAKLRRVLAADRHVRASARSRWPRLSGRSRSGVFLYAHDACYKLWREKSKATGASP